MLIATACLAGASRALAEWHPSAVVSIYSPNYPILPLHDREHLRLVCHDTELPYEGQRYGASPEQVEAVVALARRAPPRLLIHCAAGLSRSPAFAIVAAIAAGWTVREACTAMRAAACHVSPNRRILALGDDALGLTGRLRRRAEATFDFCRGPLGVVGEATGFVLPFGADAADLA